jgi:hypothetical protein
LRSGDIQESRTLEKRHPVGGLLPRVPKCPSLPPNWLPPPPLPPASVSPPSDDWRESLTLRLVFGVTSPSANHPTLSTAALPFHPLNLGTPSSILNIYPHFLTHSHLCPPPGPPPPRPALTSPPLPPGMQIETKPFLSIIFFINPSHPLSLLYSNIHSNFCEHRSAISHRSASFQPISNLLRLG